MRVGCNWSKKDPTFRSMKIGNWANISQDQWNQFAIHNIDSEAYGRPLSTVFMDNSGHVYDEDLDPTIVSLRYVDYRYLRFFYHPVEDKFSLINGWKDQSWTSAKAMRGGLDADERDSREQIFGKNNINIHQKNIPQLLMDEVNASGDTNNLDPL